MGERPGLPPDNRTPEHPSGPPPGGRSTAVTQGLRHAPPPAAPDDEGGQAPASRDCHAAVDRWRRWAPLSLVLVVSALSLFAPLAMAGIWDPPELEVAEFARRIAVQLLGAQELSLPDAVNQVPIRRELGRGELPFTSVALGFKLFGLAEWSGRLPLALWGLAGVVGTYALVRRLADRKTAAVAAALLSVTPVYFVQARTMLGDGVTLSAVSLATAGLGVGFLDPRLKRRHRCAWLALACVGLYAGFWCRGLLLGVGVPLSSVLMARWVCRSRPLARQAILLDSGLLVLVVGVLAMGLYVLDVARRGGDYSVWLGAQTAHLPAAPSHDSVVHHMGHALFPLSALLPFAVGLLLRASASVASGGGAAREQRLRALLLGSIASAIVVHSLLAPLTGVLPFSATFACATAVALLLRDLPRLGAAARVVGMGVAAVALLLLLDFRARPQTSFAAFTLFEGSFPETLLPLHHAVWGVGTLSVVGVFVCCHLEPPAVARSKGWRQRYRDYLEVLRFAFGGNLWFGLWAGLASLCAWALVVWLSERVLQLDWFATMWSLSRLVALHAWWTLGVAVFLLPLGVLWVLAGLGWLSERCGTSPWGWRRVVRWMCSIPGVTALAWLGFGLVLSLIYYPALASQLSPRRVFTSYEEHAAASEPLGVLGVSPLAARYCAEVEPHWLDTAVTASRWLTEGGQRRFLVTRASQLPELNAHFRRRVRDNLPVIDASSSEMLLVSNQLGSGANQNPFATSILSRPPSVQHELDANLGGRLDVLGWELSGMDGHPVRAMVPGGTYQLSLVYKVVARLDSDWQTFVHIDGQGRRLNADHPTLGGAYPLSLLQPGDILVDRHPIRVDPSFTKGEYRLYFGLFRGARRLPVERGKHQDNRLDGGIIELH